jgi:hypothetical protein
MAKTSKNYISPSKDAVFKMHEFLYLFENEIAQNAGQYNWNNKHLVDFCKSNDITLTPVSKSKYVKDMSKSNYIIFLKNSSTTNDDSVHDLMRHIRNAIGHALISKTAKNKAIFDLTDRTRCGSLTMRGNISEQFFFILIGLLQNSK